MFFRSLASFRVYLYNSVRNASLDYLKHKDVEGNYLQKMLDSHSTTFRMEEEEEGFFSEEVYRQLLQTIDALPDRCKEVLMYMEGKKNEEIATALHVSLETVKTQKKRAMSFLRKIRLLSFSIITNVTSLKRSITLNPFYLLTPVCNEQNVRCFS